jgi:hypothetical protein
MDKSLNTLPEWLLKKLELQKGLPKFVLFPRNSDAQQQQHQQHQQHHCQKSGFGSPREMVVYPSQGTEDHTAGFWTAFLTQHGALPQWCGTAGYRFLPQRK